MSEKLGYGRKTEIQGNLVATWRKVDMYSPEERRAAILRALTEEGRPMSMGDIRGWTLAHMVMYLSEFEFMANVRVLMRKGVITVSRSTQEFSLVKQ